jgi:diguanylate cyclase (GGDEF)-like protein
VTAQLNSWNSMPDGEAVPDQTSDVGTPRDVEPTLEPLAFDEVLDVSLLPEPDGWVDPLTGTAGPRYWDRILASEEARMRRYGRIATVALVEFPGFESAAARPGRDVALQFWRLSRVVASRVRSSDHLARIGRTRFGILLVETDEVRAINFVDRLRSACRTELGPGSHFRVRIGWASRPPAGGFEAALATAEARLRDERLQSI